jgi:hypothetical protein
MCWEPGRKVEGMGKKTGDLKRNVKLLGGGRNL